MKAIVISGIIIFIFCSCTTKIKSYSIKNVDYPEWMLIQEPNFFNKEKYSNYNKNNFFIWDTQTAGNYYSTLTIMIDRTIQFDYLNISEISFIKDGETIYLVKDKRIKNKGYVFTHLKNIRFNDYKKYYKNMELNETVEIKILQIYKFDNGPIITEEALYNLKCFEYEHTPFGGLIP